MKHPIQTVLILALLVFIIAEPSYGNFESSINGLRTKLMVVILPVLAVIGLAFSAMSFFTGNPNAKQHVFYAILGCIFGFGAQAIVDLISQTVR